MIPILIQAPSDVLPYTWDFRRFLNPPDDPVLEGDRIVEATITADPVSLILATPMIEGAGTDVRVEIGPGIIDQNYLVTLTITTRFGLTASSSRVFKITEDVR